MITRRRALAASGGLAMGAYTACLDLALGVAGPALGLIAGVVGLSAVFLTSTVVVLGASYRGKVKEAAFSGVFATVDALREAGHGPEAVCRMAGFADGCV